MNFTALYLLFSLYCYTDLVIECKKWLTFFMVDAVHAITSVSEEKSGGASGVSHNIWIHALISAL